MTPERIVELRALIQRARSPLPWIQSQYLPNADPLRHRRTALEVTRLIAEERHLIRHHGATAESCNVIAHFAETSNAEYAAAAATALPEALDAIERVRALLDKPFAHGCDTHDFQYIDVDDLRAALEGK